MTHLSDWFKLCKLTSNERRKISRKQLAKYMYMIVYLNDSTFTGNLIYLLTCRIHSAPWHLSLFSMMEPF